MSGFPPPKKVKNFKKAATLRQAATPRQAAIGTPRQTGTATPRQAATATPRQPATATPRQPATATPRQAAHPLGFPNQGEKGGLQVINTGHFRRFRNQIIFFKNINHFL